MTFELNQVLIDGEPHTLSLMARSGTVTCLTGGTPQRRSRWLLAFMGFVPVRQGFISIDGEPLAPATADAFRRLMAYAPQQLLTAGEVRRFEPPTVQDVFSLRANRQLPISNGILAEEMRRVTPDDTPAEADNIRLLAVATLLGRPILLADTPTPLAKDYLHMLAKKGKMVIVTTDNALLVEASDNIIQLS